MAKMLLLVISLTLCCTTANDADTIAIDAILGPMDYVWIVYGVLVISTSLCFILKCGLCNSWCKDEKYDALSEKAYSEIIQARGYDPNAKAFGDSRSLSLMVLRADLKRKVVWHNDWKLDFMTYIRNEHGLFSTCYGHPDHPFSRRDRKCILISVLCMDFAFAMFITWIFARFLPLDNTAASIVDFGISYIFGFMMTILESILVAFAVCGYSES